MHSSRAVRAVFILEKRREDLCEWIVTVTESEWKVRLASSLHLARSCSHSAIPGPLISPIGFEIVDIAALTYHFVLCDVVHIFLRA